MFRSGCTEERGEPRHLLEFVPGGGEHFFAARSKIPSTASPPPPTESRARMDE